MFTTKYVWIVLELRFLFLGPWAAVVYHYFVAVEGHVWWLVLISFGFLSIIVSRNKISSSFGELFPKSGSLCCGHEIFLLIFFLRIMLDDIMMGNCLHFKYLCYLIIKVIKGFIYWGDDNCRFLLFWGLRASKSHGGGGCGWSFVWWGIDYTFLRWNCLILFDYIF